MSAKTLGLFAAVIVGSSPYLLSLVPGDGSASSCCCASDLGLVTLRSSSGTTGLGPPSAGVLGGGFLPSAYPLVARGPGVLLVTLLSPIFADSGT